MLQRTSSNPFHGGRNGASRGFTFLELALAVAIALTFMAALYTSFITMIRTADANSARLEALRNARMAVMTITDELKAISGLSSAFIPTLIGINNTAPFGDGIDDDVDGVIDEEELDGLDNDGDWVAARDDLHARIGLVDPLYDRFMYTQNAPFDARYGGGAQDLGDFRVDEDCRFGRDSIVFRIVPTVPVQDLLFRTITYTIGPFSGQQNVLLRQARTEFTAASGRAPLLTTSPLAFGALGLDFLYWDPNGNPNPGSTWEERPKWRTSWDSTNAATFDPPRLPLPASIYARVTCMADRTAENTYRDGDRVKTLKVETMVNLEQIIGDVTYPRPRI
jgi:type II secretory pathway pseudopilin PulG